MVRGITSRDSEVNTMGTYYLFANAFGYTPQQTDELDLFTIQSLGIIHEAKCKEEERAMKNARRR